MNGSWNAATIRASIMKQGYCNKATAHAVMRPAAMFGLLAYQLTQRGIEWLLLPRLSEPAFIPADLVVGCITCGAAC